MLTPILHLSQFFDYYLKLFVSCLNNFRNDVIKTRCGTLVRVWLVKNDSDRLVSICKVSQRSFFQDYSMIISIIISFFSLPVFPVNYHSILTYFYVMYKLYFAPEFYQFHMSCSNCMLTSVLLFVKFIL